MIALDILYRGIFLRSDLRSTVKAPEVTEGQQLYFLVCRLLLTLSNENSYRKDVYAVVFLLQRRSELCLH